MDDFLTCLHKTESIHAVFCQTTAVSYRREYHKFQGATHAYPAPQIILGTICLRLTRQPIQTYKLECLYNLGQEQPCVCQCAKVNGTFLHRCISFTNL